MICCGRARRRLDESQDNFVVSLARLVSVKIHFMGTKRLQRAFRSW